jgi:RimJ/RimL family protein N-acetyltransferase
MAMSEPAVPAPALSEPFGLEGRTVHLLPLSLDHVDGLLEAAGGDRSSFGYTAVPSDRADMTDYVERAIARRASGEQVPFATWSVALGRVVGSTRFYDLSQWDWTTTLPRAGPAGQERTADSASIGHTWLDPAAQRTPVNTEAKLLMMDRAFGVWGVRVVRLWTDARNARSRSAIARLGCRLDGVLRADRPASDGSVRDSAVFSMLADEWPTAREHLVGRLGAAGTHRGP